MTAHNCIGNPCSICFPNLINTGMSTGNNQYWCSICNKMIYYNEGHFHSNPNTWTYYPSFSQSCDHCFCRPVDENGMTTGVLDHKKCCMCPTRKQIKRKQTNG